MARKEMKKLIVIMAFTLMTLFATAQQGNYQVLFSNSDKIKIGNQTARKGLRFNDENEISMPSEKCALKIRNLSDGTIKLIVGEKLNKSKAKTISQYLVVERELSTKGIDERKTIEFDTLTYMLDTLIIPILTYHSGKITAQAVVYIGNDHFEIPVSRLEKEMAYVIPRNSLGKLDDKPFCIDIIEKDIEKDWEYAIWRKLYIVPLPLY